MKSLVVYSSKTGNTKKLAETVFNALPGQKEIFPVDGSPDPSTYDFVAVGFWLQAGKPDRKASVILTRVGCTKLFLFATHGAAADSCYAAGAMIHARHLAPLAEVLGTFNCQGEVEPAFLQKAKAKDPQPPWINDASAAIGHPDKADLDRLSKTVAALFAGGSMVVLEHAQDRKIPRTV